MKRGSLAQVSMEFLMVIAFSMAVMVPLVYFYFNESQQAVEDVNEAQIIQVARKLVTNAEIVHAFGEPSSVTLRVFIPQGITSIALNQTEIIFLVHNGGDIITMSEVFSMNVSGSISNASGIHKLKITAVNDSVVINDV